jgi:glycosyltransferase involved in cell wall biosynthesis
MSRFELPVISVLVPTRGRKNLLLNMLASLFGEAAEPDAVEVVIYIDDDDDETQTLDLSEFNLKRIVGPRQSMGTLIAACFAQSTGDIILLGNDDVVIRTRGWDTKIRQAVARFPDQVYLFYPNDLFKGAKLATFPILSRLTCDTIADPFPGEYRGAFIDVHVMDIFKQVKGAGFDRVVFLEDVVFEHLHYRLGKSELDETYLERDRFADDETFMALFGARQWASQRLLALINGTKADTKERLDSFRPKIGWFVSLTWDVLFKGTANPLWRLRLFSWLWLRYIYRILKRYF